MAPRPYISLTQPDRTEIRVMIQHLVSWTEQQINDGYGGRKKITRVTTTMGSHVVIERAVDIADQVRSICDERT